MRRRQVEPGATVEQEVRPDEIEPVLGKVAEPLGLVPSERRTSP
jgi:hypothetical protein